MSAPARDGSTPPLVQSLFDVLAGVRLPLDYERRLQSALAEALDEAGLPYVREHPLGPPDRVDFLLGDNIAVECKLRAGRRQIYRQLRRYAASPEVEALVLVTNTAMGLPEMIEGKPTFYCSLGSSWL